MDNNNKENNFMDSKTLIAVALVAVVWFGWQKYLSAKYPHMNDPIAATDAKTSEKAPSPGTAAPSSAPNTALSADTAAMKVGAAAPAPETTFDVSDDAASFKISSSGMGLKNFQLKQYTKRDHSPIEFAAGLPAGLFELSLIGQDHALPMQVTKQNDTTYVGVAQAGAATITRTMVYNSKTYSFDNEITVANAGPDFRGISLLIPEKKEEVKSSGFLSGNYEHQEYYLAHSGNKTDRVNISSAKEDIKQSFTNLSVAGVSSQYFATAIVDKSTEIVPSVDLLSTHASGDFSARLNYNVSTTKDKMTFTFKTFAGPKGHDILAQVDPTLTDIVNFGMFGAIGKILLVILKFFYSVVGNWGWSIILLTLLVRLLVLPVNLASFKSMKRMKVIQPMMQGLREKYKDDPASLQRETMALMKREKVNPLGGCLPMLLQMPIFFALFQVLGHSIELYQAPFIGWITDLSLKDPIYVMPVLIGIVFFIQQKITPTTMDPAQAKVMQFMPIMFAFMMLSLPSGLTLYTFISTLFGITQQRIFMRDKNSAKEATPVRA